MPALQCIPDSTHDNYFLLRVSHGPRIWMKATVWHIFYSWNREEKKKTWLLVPMGITLLFSLSLLFMSCCDLFICLSIFDFFCCCCAFVSFLVVSGKLKCHPSPIHRPDRDGEPSQPPPSSIHLPSLLHPPISTLVSVVMGNSDNGTLMGKKYARLGLPR